MKSIVSYELSVFTNKNENLYVIDGEKISLKLIEQLTEQDKSESKLYKRLKNWSTQILEGKSKVRQSIIFELENFFVFTRLIQEIDIINNISFEEYIEKGYYEKIIKKIDDLIEIDLAYIERFTANMTLEYTPRWTDDKLKYGTVFLKKFSSVIKRVKEKNEKNWEFGPKIFESAGAVNDGLEYTLKILSERDALILLRTMSDRLSEFSE